MKYGAESTNKGTLHGSSTGRTCAEEKDQDHRRYDEREMETYVDDRPLLLRRWFELESDEWETTLVEAAAEESCWGCWEWSEWPEDDGSL